MAQFIASRKGRRRPGAEELGPSGVRQGGTFLRLVSSLSCTMSNSVQDLPIDVSEASQTAKPAVNIRPASLRLRILLALPFALLFALGIHWWASKQQLPTEAQPYSVLLWTVLAGSLVAAAVQPFSLAL